MSAERNFLLKDLNDAQKEAVSAPRENMLIIAGAGTGKTRVLVSRIAWLIGVEQVQPRRILAVTFTNKAAAEMRQRIGAISGEEVQRALWTSTFHSLCLRLLRAYANQAGLTPDFTVMDSDGQKLLVKRIEKDLGIDIGDYRPAMVAASISRFKERGLRFKNIEHAQMGDYGATVRRVYKIYEKSCIRENIVDFSELILRTVELLEGNERVRELQHRRFEEILVDEFQDTSSLQYKLLGLLKGPQSHVLAVGDDDQSIYGWRGADFTNMQNFLKDFKPVHQVALLENYRSGQNILDMANTLISGNNDRLIEKKLKNANGGSGPQVTVMRCRNEELEAQAVLSEVRALKRQGMRLCDMAVLYRNNSLSGVMEKTLSTHGVDYVIYGGLKFFERAEILDAVAYMRLLLNENDDTALYRIINVPSRKIGPSVVSKLQEVASERGCSLLQAIKLVREYGKMPEAAKALVTIARRIEGFASLMEELQQGLEHMSSLSSFAGEVVQKSGLYIMYKEKDEKEKRGEYDNLRHKNLEELVNNAAAFEREHQGEDASDDEALASLSPQKRLLLEYLSSVSLAAGTELNAQGQAGASVPGDRLNLMTIHSSKGLEFRAVFLIGFDNKILPSQRSLESREDGTEEERRLAYVAMTRARERLYLSYADYRRIFGRLESSGPSIFLRQMLLSYSGKRPQPFVTERI
ncbi:MAG: UvrD-helicase domain-containing protein [Succinivibrio sp.]|jgi:DNA helicase-2/ATP-dependent DNA helicase PcrA|nr:UvrD-helicase domain-containing protein [Succinivibrio sp.]